MELRVRGGEDTVSTFRRAVAGWGRHIARFATCCSECVERSSPGKILYVTVHGAWEQSDHRSVNGIIFLVLVGKSSPRRVVTSCRSV